MSKEHSPHPKHHEAAKHHETAEHQAHSERVKAHHEREAAKEVDQATVPELEQRANKEAKAASEAVVQAKEKESNATEYVSGELKKQTLDRTFTQVRKHLSAPNRAFSRVIHQPVVESISNVSSKTVARPSGFLGGSIVAFVGSSTFLWFAKHYGFNYNYLLFVLFFAGGFVLGMFLELLLFAVRPHKKS